MQPLLLLGVWAVLHLFMRSFQSLTSASISAGLVFLQSDILNVSVAMRNAFEQHASDAFQPAPQHTQDGVFFAEISDDKAPSSAGQQCKSITGTDTDYANLSETIASAEQHVKSRDAAGDDAVEVSNSQGGDESPSTTDKEPAGEVASSDPPFESQWATAGWLKVNPIGVPTEREHYVLSCGGAAYRLLLVKK